MVGFATLFAEMVMTTGMRTATSFGTTRRLFWKHGKSPFLRANYCSLRRIHMWFRLVSDQQKRCPRPFPFSLHARLCEKNVRDDEVGWSQILDPLKELDGYLSCSKPRVLRPSLKPSHLQNAIKASSFPRGKRFSAVSQQNVFRKSLVQQDGSEIRIFPLQ